MPTYQYRCTECGRDLEVVQKFSDPSLTECPSCTGALRKVFNAVGVVFKGSGFYRTDSRTTPTEVSGDKAAEKSTDKGDKPSESKPAETKPAEKPAAASAGADSKGASGSGSASSTGTKAAAR